MEDHQLITDFILHHYTSGVSRSRLMITMGKRIGEASLMTPLGDVIAYRSADTPLNPPFVVVNDVQAGDIPYRDTILSTLQRYMKPYLVTTAHGLRALRQ